MKQHIHPLTQWVINKIETEYKDDIALLIGIQGHSTDNDKHGECFDYFIPTTERGNELAQTFIIDGVGHDLYPRSWERVAQSAQLQEMAVVLANATILYSKSQEDIERFQALQQQLADNLKNPTFVYGKALECLDKALEIYRSFLFEEKSYRARSEAEYIHLYLSQAVAYLNNTFTDSPIFNERQAYDSTPQSSLYHCPGMMLIPDGFFAYARQLLTTQEVPKLREIVHGLIATTRAFVLERKPDTTLPPKTVNYAELADWYQELSLTWRRIRYFCRHNMVEKAYKDACYLQNELLYVAEEFQMEELNLLDSFLPEDLELLALRSNQLEQVIRQTLSHHQIPLKEYASLEDFLVANSGGGC
ncbi:MAG: hypothetical protein IJ379_07410 [Lachnospiraceae bacterium]|nr:hypothetical protein [Lachnospiraceae bacterium]